MPVSHPSGWGVHPAATALPGQVIWAWPEMSYGFLYGIERLGAELGEGWSREAPGPDWKIVHFFGFDNSFYHSILYPVLYRLAFPEWNPDIDYHVNEFYLLDGEKFSTSRRHAVWGKDLLTPTRSTLSVTTSAEPGPRTSAPTSAALNSTARSPAP